LLPTSNVGKVEAGKVWCCVDYRSNVPTVRGHL
jgi:hypothetical protein